MKTVNTLNVTGLLKEADLQEGTSKGSGRDYIRGNIVIDTGTEEAPNEIKLAVLQMIDKKDKQKNDGTMIPDPRFTTLQKLMEPEAIDTKITVNGSIGNNIFVDREGNVVKGTNLSAGFYNVPGSGKVGNQFRVTMAILSVEPELNSEEEETGSAVVKGYAYDFRGTQIPLKLYVDNPSGVEFFMGLGADPTTPVLKDVWGRIENVQLAPKTEESAFGEAFEVQSSLSVSRRVITGAELKDREVTDEILDFFKKGKEAYNVAVASAEADHAERQANKVPAGGGVDTTKPPTSGAFNF